MRNLVKFSAFAVAAMLATAAYADMSNMTFAGYVRAGVGLNSEGGDMACFHLAGADTKYRLGNECDYVIEPNFDYVAVKLDDKSTWGVHIMPSVYKAWNGALIQGDVSEAQGGPIVFNTNADGLTAKWGQVYFFGNNVPQLLNGSIWGGRKYSNRLQTGINDQFLENNDGDGFGIDDMNLGGFAKWSIGVQMDPNVVATDVDVDGNPAFQPSDLTKTYALWTSLRSIGTFQNAFLSVYGGYYGRSKAKDDTSEFKDGYTIAAYHNANLGKWGSNLLGAKYDTRGGGTLWRVVLQHGIVFESARTSLDFITEYRDSKADGATDHAKWFTIGARTDTNISGPFRFLLEAGYDQTQVGSADAINLLKVTGVLAVSAGKDAGSRPTFRLFYTYGSWSDPGANDGANAQLAFGDKKSGGSFGVQAEGWW